MRRKLAILGIGLTAVAVSADVGKGSDDVQPATIMHNPKNNKECRRNFQYFIRKPI